MVLTVKHFKQLPFFPLQEKINHEILNSKMFSLDQQALRINTKKSQRGAEAQRNRYKSSASVKAHSKMNIHNNEAGRRVSTT